MRTLARSTTFKKSAGNAAYSVADYLAQPLAMLLAAPLLIHKLGLSQYGVWMLVNAVVGGMGTVSGGFGDAAVKYVSGYRGRQDAAGVARTIRGMITINGALGAILGAIVVLSSRSLVAHVFRIEAAFSAASIIALQIGGALLFVRSLDSVFVATLRAFERYGPTVRINVVSRAATVIVAIVLAGAGRGVVAIMAATLAISIVALIFHVLAARNIAGPFLPLPLLDAQPLRELFSFGCFSWLQALASVGFNYADRLLVASMLGTTALAYYVVCVQAAQPIHGITQAALNFVFPHMSARHNAGETAANRRVFRFTLAANILLVLAMAVPLALLSRPLLRIWMGPSFASNAASILTILAIGFALLAMNITAHYTLLAHGDVRLVSGLNVAGGIITLIAAAALASPFGLTGVAVGRLLYGPITCAGYFRALRLLRREEPRSVQSLPLQVGTVGE